jgi:hypothetical protein
LIENECGIGNSQLNSVKKESERKEENICIPEAKLAEQCCSDSIRKSLKIKGIYPHQAQTGSVGF